MLTVLAAMGLMAMAQETDPAEAAPPPRHYWLPSVHVPRISFHRRHNFTLRKKNVGQNGWQVWVRKDNFSGEIKCYVASLKTATQGRVTYADGTLGFEVKGYADPNTTWFLADGNPAQKLSSVYQTVYGRGQAVPPMSTNNLDRTIVLIPMESVMGADTVFLRISDKDKPKRFRMIGFPEALQAAQENGCTEGNYVRDKF